MRLAEVACRRHGGEDAWQTELYHNIKVTDGSSAGAVFSSPVHHKSQRPSESIEVIGM